MAKPWGCGLGWQWWPGPPQLWATGLAADGHGRSSSRSCGWCHPMIWDLQWKGCCAAYGDLRKRRSRLASADILQSASFNLPRGMLTPIVHGVMEWRSWDAPRRRRRIWSWGNRSVQVAKGLQLKEVETAVQPSGHDSGRDVKKWRRPGGDGEGRGSTHLLPERQTLVTPTSVWWSMYFSWPESPSHN